MDYQYNKFNKLFQDIKTNSVVIDSEFKILWYNNYDIIKNYEISSEKNTININKIHYSKEFIKTNLLNNGYFSCDFHKSIFEFIKFKFVLLSSNPFHSIIHIENIKDNVDYTSIENIEQKHNFNIYQKFSKYFRDIISSNDIIYNAINKILSEDPSIEKDTYIDTLTKNNFKILRQIYNIYIYQSLIENNDKSDFEYQDFTTHISTVLKSLKLLLISQNIDFVYDIQEQKNICYFSPSKIVHVITNILSNSFTFTKDFNKIYIKYSFDENNIFLKFTDKGRGMSNYTLKNAKKAFFSYSEDDSYCGLGLGLSIVNEIVKSHNGSLIIESAIYNGTTVCISIPIVQDPNKYDDKDYIYQKNYIKDRFSPLYIDLADFITLPR